MLPSIMGLSAKKGEDQRERVLAILGNLGNTNVFISSRCLRLLNTHGMSKAHGRSGSGSNEKKRSSENKEGGGCKSYRAEEYLYLLTRVAFGHSMLVA